MKDGTYYVAYGSNINIYQMIERCPDAVIMGIGVLENYELQFRGRMQHAYATIQEKQGSQVPILLWNISDHDEARLDRYEGYPIMYGKKAVEVLVGGTTYSAMLYEMQPGMAFNLPSKEYYQTIATGYALFQFPMSVLEQALEQVKTQMQQNEHGWEMQL